MGWGATTSTVYFDYNASAPLLEIARTAMMDALEYTGNPSSVHSSGRSVRRLLEDARSAVAASVTAAPAEVVFTSGATEANALACAGLAPEHIAATAIEHDSILDLVAPSRRIPVRADGTVDLDRLGTLLDQEPRPKLLAVMLANNETGVIQPVAEAAALARAAGVPVHCDAVQGWRRIAFTFGELGVDSLALSAHKAGGPKGIGALVARRGALRQAVLYGGGQERGWRAGTENVAAAAGFGAVAAAPFPEPGTVQALRDDLERAVRAAVPETQVIAESSPRLSNTSMLALPGRDSETLVIRLDLEGIAVSAGSACSSGRVGPSHVLEAMSLPPAISRSAVRVSLGPQADPVEVDKFVAAWKRVAITCSRRATH